MKFRVFTLHEANALIPELESIFSRFEAKKSEQTRLHDELFMHELIRQSHPSGENYDPGRQLDSAAQALEACLEEAVAELEKIRTLGCVLRSLERGWVDFLAQKDGKQVFLCWRRGEPAVRYYHSTGRPISDRRPLA